MLVAMAVLVGLILLMSGSSGGLFARKLVLRSYFENAAGVKDGAPVTLQSRSTDERAQNYRRRQHRINWKRMGINQVQAGAEWHLE